MPSRVKQSVNRVIEYHVRYLKYLVNKPYGVLDSKPEASNVTAY